jgi:formylglycine-generating enzyme required for sulfatase activity
MEDIEDTVLVITDGEARVRRGGAFPYGATFQRSAHRGPTTALPTNRRDNVGFRVARTYR